MKKFFLIGLVLLTLAKIVCADELAPLIIHTPVKEVFSGMDLSINVTVIDNDPIEKVELCYRTKGESIFYTLPMNPTGNLYQATILGDYVTTKGIEYYIEAKDISSNVSFEPKENYIAAPFSVSVKPSVGTPAPLKKPYELTTSATGKLIFRSASATYNPQRNPASVPPLTYMAINPGDMILYDFNSTSISKNKTVLFWLNKDTEVYTNKIKDKYKFSIILKSSNINIGDFTESFSDLSLSNAKVRGLQLKTTRDKNNFNIIFGRTMEPVPQEPKAFPIYGQYTSALRQELNLDDKTFLFLNAASSKDDRTSIPTPTTNLKPISNTLISGGIQTSYYKNFVASLEAMICNVDTDITDNVSAVTDKSYKIKLEYKSGDTLNIKTSYYRLGRNFVTAGVLPTYMQNNRLGFTITGEYKPNEIITFSPNYEQFKEVSYKLATTTLVKTTNLGGSLKITSEKYPSLTGSYSRSEKKGDLISAYEAYNTSYSARVSYCPPEISGFANSKISGSYMRIDYEDKVKAILLGINIRGLGLETSYKDLLTFSSSYNETDSKDLKKSILTSKQVVLAGITFNAIPEKLTTNFTYEVTVNKKNDNSTNNLKTETGFAYNYNFSPDTLLSLGIKFVDYKDNVNKDNDFKTGIFTVKYQRSLTHKFKREIKK